MSTHSLYFHGENVRDSKLIEVPESATIQEIIIIYLKEFPNSGEVEAVDLFLEDEDNPKEKQDAGHHSGVKNHSHVHFHRCKTIEVAIIYNGDHKIFHYPPSATVNRILSKALEAFKINPHDAGDYLLKLDDRTILNPGDHIGSFTAHPRCQVKLFLTAARPVQG